MVRRRWDHLRCRVAGSAAARGFTIVELAVVIAVIGLVLAIAVPGLRKMSEDARFASAIQSINGTLQRAHVAAQGDQSLTAVRFVPGAWDIDERANAQGEPNRQHLVSYRYVGASETERNGNFVPEFGERFGRRPELDSVVLPSDIWVAPIEAWRDNRPDPLDPSRSPLDTSILSGTIGEFELDPMNSGEGLLEADDFMVVIDAQTGVRGGRSAFQIVGYDPDVDRERMDDENNNPSTRVKFLRSSSEGVVIYRREAFAALGSTAAGVDRQNALRRLGRPYFVHRQSGALVMGTQEE